jgi:hypothetical protein
MDGMPTTSIMALVAPNTTNRAFVQCFSPDRMFCSPEATIFFSAVGMSTVQPFLLLLELNRLAVLVVYMEKHPYIHFQTSTDTHS